MRKSRPPSVQPSSHLHLANMHGLHQLMCGRHSRGIQQGGTTRTTTMTPVSANVGSEAGDNPPETPHERRAPMSIDMETTCVRLWVTTAHSRTPLPCSLPTAKSRGSGQSQAMALQPSRQSFSVKTKSQIKSCEVSKKSAGGHFTVIISVA